MRNRPLSGHQSARMKSDEYLTPPEILLKLGHFDLDPCASRRRPWRIADQHWTKFDDGLNRQLYGRVWMNPPFGQQASVWMRKMAAHNNGIALIPARTETAMFYESVWPKATAILFVKGRPHFYKVDGTRHKSNSGAPICLVAYGVINALYLRRCGLGKYIHLKD